MSTKRSSGAREKKEKKGCLPDILAHQCGDCTYYCCLCPPKSRISFGIWANMQGFWAAIALLFTTIIAASFTQTSNTVLYQAGQYVKYVNFPIAIFVMCVEYPRGKKRGGGRVEERPFQSYIAPIHYFFRFLTRNYFLRGILYIFLSGPSQFSLSTTLSGWWLFISGLFYFIAALYDECWEPPTLAWGRGSKKPKKDKPKTGGQEMDMMEAPTEPPPRMDKNSSSPEKEIEVYTNPASS